MYDTNEELVNKIKNNIDATNNTLKLWEQNQGIIEKLANKYCHMAEKEDLKQEAYFAICKAIDSYDPNKGNDFFSWEIFWIKQRMQRYCQNNGIIRLPVYANEKLQQYRKLKSFFNVQFGRMPNIDECCYYLECTEETFEKLEKFENISNVGSIDSPINNSEDGDITVRDCIADLRDDYGSLLDDIEQQQLQETLWGLVNELPECQADVIKKRFQDDLTIKETAEQAGLTTNDVRKYQTKGLKKLREPEQAELIRMFYDASRIYSDALHGNGTTRFNTTWTSSTERVAIKKLR